MASAGLYSQCKNPATLAIFGPSGAWDDYTHCCAEHMPAMKRELDTVWDINTNQQIE